MQFDITKLIFWPIIFPLRRNVINNKRINKQTSEWTNFEGISIIKLEMSVNAQPQISFDVFTQRR